MCVKSHIVPVISAQRRLLGLSQQDVATLAGLRREKINRVESRYEDLSVSDLVKILDVLDLKLVIAAKEAHDEDARAVSKADDWPSGNHVLQPARMPDASFVDGAKAKILKWGNVR